MYDRSSIFVTFLKVRDHERAIRQKLPESHGSAHEEKTLFSHDGLSGKRGRIAISSYNYININYINLFLLVPHILDALNIS